MKPLRQSNFTDRVHQAKVALLDEVEQRQAGRLVLLGDGYQEAQIGLHELAFGLLTLAGGAAQLPLLGGRDVGAAGEGLDRLLGRFDRRGETDLVILGQQPVLPDVGEVETNEVFVIAINATTTILRHGGSFVTVPRATRGMFSRYGQDPGPRSRALHPPLSCPARTQWSRELIRRAISRTTRPKYISRLLVDAPLPLMASILTVGRRLTQPLLCGQCWSCDRRADRNTHVTHNESPPGGSPGRRSFPVAPATSTPQALVTASVWRMRGRLARGSATPATAGATRSWDLYVRVISGLRTAARLRRPP